MHHLIINTRKHQESTPMKQLITAMLCLWATVLSAMADQVYVTGTVKDAADDSPLSYIRVTLYDGSDELDYEYTDWDGCFSIAVPEGIEGDLTLSAYYNGYADAEATVHISPGETPAPVTILMEENKARVTLRVTSNSLPVACAQYRVEQDWETYAEGEITGGTAEFVIRRVSKYPYTLQIWGKGYDDYSNEVTLVDGDNTVEATLTGDQVGIAAINGDEVDVLAAGGCLTLTSAQETYAEIYSADGRKVTARNVCGTASIHLAKGLYIVKINEKNIKIIIL